MLKLGQKQPDYSPVAVCRPYTLPVYTASMYLFFPKVYRINIFTKILNNNNNNNHYFLTIIVAVAAVVVFASQIECFGDHMKSTVDCVSCRKNERSKEG